MDFPHFLGSYTISEPRILCNLPCSIFLCNIPKRHLYPVASYDNCHQRINIEWTIDVFSRNFKPFFILVKKIFVFFFVRVSLVYVGILFPDISKTATTISFIWLSYGHSLKAGSTFLRVNTFFLQFSLRQTLIQNYWFF